MWGISKFAPVIPFTKHWQILIILSLCSSATFFCLAGILSFKQAKTTVNPIHPEEASTLVKTGVYRISRNPMYFGFALFLAAWAAYLSTPFALVGLFGFIFYMNQFQIIPEEQTLSEIFGSEFEEYKMTVRRWL